MRQPHNLDDAVVGIHDTWGKEGRTRSRSIYDGDRVIAALIEQGLDEQEAREYLDGLLFGPEPPLVVWPQEDT